ncbi:MAG TPA: DUF6152 family protein [Candidatus Acidoferrales bacterium]|nr:DUF6152 family protein [Candidatus Acidoferrales bacterium]
MRKRAIGVFAVAAGLLSVSLPLFAHHGTAVFETEKVLTLKGNVTEWDWSNPHCLLQFDFKNDAGQVVHWIAETQNPAEMISLGWGKASFKPGDEVTVSLMPVRNGRPYGRIKQVALANGTTFITVKAGFTPKENGDLPGGSKSENYPKQ